ncbi:MAG: NifB/NifX family molybdenum-iron cluster-binding protein [Spirochaetia bacterium]|nr:NifB/NifX family molybdenum-iron cluster-binding protein [Spirochaetia bacterium]
MKIGVTLEDEKGITGNVSSHFGQCPFFLIADIKDEKIGDVKVVRNGAEHGGGGCQAVAEILKYGVTHVISGGMGMGAQQKFAAAGVKVFGYSGKTGDAIQELLKSGLGALENCKEHGHDHGNC